MTRQELVKADYKVNVEILEAQIANLRSQINIIEAQIKEKKLRIEDYHYQYGEFLKNETKEEVEVFEPEEENQPKTLKKIR